VAITFFLEKTLWPALRREGREGFVVFFILLQEIHLSVILSFLLALQEVFSLQV